MEGLLWHSTVNTYHVFACYQLVNLVACLFNCYGKALPYIATAGLWISLTSFFVILITVRYHLLPKQRVHELTRSGTIRHTRAQTRLLRLPNLHQQHRLGKQRHGLHRRPN